MKSQDLICKLIVALTLISIYSLQDSDVPMMENNWSKTSPTNYWSIGHYFVGYSIWFIYGTSC